MSIRIMSKVWDFYPGGGTDLLALLALADWSDDEGRCYPSMSAISKKIRLSRSQAQRIVHSLIDADFVRVIGNEFGGAPGASRQYQIILERLTGSTGATGSVHATGRTDAQDGSHGCAETGSTGATQTTIEPSLTTSKQFAQFWNAYPRKKNRGDAEKAFKALKVDDALLSKMLSALAIQKPSSDWLKDGGKFIPYPASWLRGKRWEDEVSSFAGVSADEFAGAI